MQREMVARQVVIEYLRGAIMNADMVPGQRLVEAELAGQLGVTRASVRAALFDLSSDGLIRARTGVADGSTTA